MVDVITQIIIRRSRDKVSEYTSNLDNSPEWYVNIKSVEWKTDKPLKVGSKIAFKARFLGRELAYVYEIVDFVPKNKLIMRTSDGPFSMETTYIWESIDGRTTRMTLRNRGTPTGFSKLFVPFMTFAMKIANKKDLKLLKKIMESQS